MGLKEEWHGPDGIASVLRRSAGIGSTEEMARAVQPDSFPESQTADEILKFLLEEEYQRYLRICSELNMTLFSSAANIAGESPQRYPETHSALTKYLSEIGEDPLLAVNHLSEMAIIFADSQAQSRKTRAGKSLELHLEYVLNGFGIDTWEKQKSLQHATGSTTVDFIFPSVEHYRKNPLDCIAFSCQTTSNDRYRLALSQVPHVQKYIPTGIGCDNFGSKLAVLTEEKLEAVKASGAFYVLFPSGKNKKPHMKSHPAIITYQDLMNRLLARGEAWI